MAQHLEETRRQQQMLEQLLGRFGESPSTLKEMVMKLAGNLQSMFHASASDEVLKNLFALYAFEHFEQASYLSLIAMAEDCGEAEVASTCRQILQQEEATGEKLRGDDPADHPGLPAARGRRHGLLPLTRGLGAGPRRPVRDAGRQKLELAS